MKTINPVRNSNNASKSPRKLLKQTTHAADKRSRISNGIKAEYIWLDGQKPTAELRSKTKIIDGPVTKLSQISDWGFDGSSTEQAEGRFSDCKLAPVSFFSDPLRDEGDILVIAEALNADGLVHESNSRACLREIAEKYASSAPWFGIEQEYTLFRGTRPLGFPERGFPAPQGREFNLEMQHLRRGK